MAIPQLDYSPVNGHWFISRFLSFTNKVAKNMDKQVFVWKYVILFTVYTLEWNGRVIWEVYN